MRRQTKRQILQRSAKKSRSSRDGGKPKCVIHTAEEIEGIRQAAATTAGILETILAGIRPGVTLNDLDLLAGVIMRDHGVDSAFKGYLGFPGEICISVNDEVVHGVSCRDRIIQLGDIVSVDCGTRCGGYIGDTAKTVSVGPAVGPGTATPYGTSASPSKTSSAPQATKSYATLSATAAVSNCMKHRRCRTTRHQNHGSRCTPEWCWHWSPWLTLATIASKSTTTAGPSAQSTVAGQRISNI